MSYATVTTPNSAPCGPKFNEEFLACAGMHDSALQCYRYLLQQANHALAQKFLNGTPATELVRAHAEFVDQLLVHIWSTHTFKDNALADSLINDTPASASVSVALVAVGGYGRGELHPGSDIDLLILVGDTQHTACQSRIEQFITLLWDIGLEVAHSTRSPQECQHEAAQDVTIATNLMEARLLAGPPLLFQTMRESVGADRIWPTRRFFEAKWAEQIQRHHKYHDTAYNLEPNIKEGPGGLRDIQTIAWVAQRHFGEATLHDLVSHGFLTELEYDTLIEAQGFLWRIRFALHILTGRREDRLLFDYQRTLAKQFGYEDEAHRLAVEQFMKRYYRTVMELSRLNEMLLQLFQEAILYAEHPQEIAHINKRFQARNNFIEVINNDTFKTHPFALLEIFLLLAQHRELTGVRASTIRLIRDHRYLIDDQFRADLRCRTLFMELLRQPYGITHELRRMNRYGVLAAYLPVFGNIVGQMQHDLFHVYTVDEHTLFLVRNLRRFALPEFAHEFPRCHEIFQKLPRAEVLYVAGLFHDIAKGRGGDHSELGAQDAREFCLHHGMSGYDTRLVVWLVKSHLVMSSTAQRQDIADPDVISIFTTLVGDQVRLNYLYLLTVADIRATNTTLWNGWKDSLLAELYLATTRALRHGLVTPIGNTERIQEIQTETQKILRQNSVNNAELKRLWAELGDDYFLRYAPDEIAWHSQAIIAAEPSDLPLVLIRKRSQHGGTELFVYAHDEDYLFAVATTALDQMALTVHDARIITSNSGYTLNTFIILEESGEAVDGAQRIVEISTTLKQQLLHPATHTSQVTRRARRQLQHFPVPTQIIFARDERNQRTVMEVISADRPGLLSKVGKVFMECGVRLQNAKIATFGARAEDIFFITDRHNKPLQGETQLACLREAIIKYLDT